MEGSLSRPAVLMVSKPVTPPWNDSGKNLVRVLATSLRGRQVHVLTTDGAPPLADHVCGEPVYGTPGRFAPSLAANARVFFRLLRPDRLSIYHFFFAPNRRSLAMVKLAMLFKRRHLVHTICSAPSSFEEVSGLLFARRVVALSRDTAKKLAGAGVEGARHIPPSVPAPTSGTPEGLRRVRRELEAETGPLLLFCGDYDFSRTAWTVMEAVPAILGEHPDAVVVFACRMKTARSSQLESEVQELARSLGLEQRVRFLRELPWIHELLAAADLLLMPAEDLYAKMDIPLVVLEAMALGMPVVVADRGPLSELLDDDVGEAVPPGVPEALAGAVVRLLGDPAALKAKGEVAARVARERYSPEVMARAYEDLYDELESEQV